MSENVSARVMRAIEDIHSNHELSLALLPDCELVMLGALSESDFLSEYNIYRSLRGAVIQSGG